MSHVTCCDHFAGLQTFDGVGCQCRVALLQPHSHLNNRKNNLEVNLSEQSVKECNSSLLLTIDSHHQQ